MREAVIAKICRYKMVNNLEILLVAKEINFACLKQKQLCILRVLEKTNKIKKQEKNKNKNKNKKKRKNSCFSNVRVYIYMKNQEIQLLHARLEKTTLLEIISSQLAKFKTLFLSCYCHELCMVEAVGLKNANHSLEIAIF